MYIRRKQIIKKGPLGGELSECEKIPYGYIDVMATLDNSIVEMKDILYVKSFKQFGQTDIFFYDKNSVYAFQDSPATYPQFSEINIDSQEASIVDSLYIKDPKNVYWKRIKVPEANAISLSTTNLRTINGENIV